MIDFFNVIFFRTAGGIAVGDGEVQIGNLFILFRNIVPKLSYHGRDFFRIVSFYDGNKLITAHPRNNAVRFKSIFDYTGSAFDENVALRVSVGVIGGLQIV